MTRQLPMGWELKRLGDVAKAIYGYTESASYNDVGPKFLRITDIQENGVNWQTVPFCKIVDADLEKYKLNDGDIVFARTGATTGKSFLVRKPPISVFASYLIKVHIKDKNIIPEYLYLFFQTKIYWDTINAGISGSAQGGFNATKLSELNIPIPPIKDQKRIVAILDEAFTAIAKPKENAEKNLKNARELFDSYLQNIFANPSPDWEEKNLGDVCGFVRGPFGGSLKKNIFKADGYAVYEQQHAIYDKFDEIRYFIDEEKFNEMKRFELKSGDLIMSCSGTMGKIAIVPNGVRKGIINQALLKLTPSNKISAMFLRLYMKSDEFQQSLKAYSQGAAIQNVASVKILKEIKVLLPPVEEQHLIVAKLDALSAETKRLETIYKKKLSDLEELKKSILQKAFSGELTEVNQ